MEEVKIGGCTHRCKKQEEPKHDDHVCNCGYFWGFSDGPVEMTPLPPNYQYTTVQ